VFLIRLKDKFEGGALFRSAKHSICRLLIHFKKQEKKHVIRSGVRVQETDYIPTARVEKDVDMYARAGFGSSHTAVFLLLLGSSDIALTFSAF
jgi:hypothetical protein